MPGVSFFPLSDVPFLSLFFNFYGYYLPLFLYAVWTPLAIYDLSATSYRSSTSKVLWTLIVLLIPLTLSNLAVAETKVEWKQIVKQLKEEIVES